jgi:glycosyltransferase involved in cell wall biosynthesis
VSEGEASSLGPVSVVIPTFNRRKLLAKNILPLLDDPSTGEVVVVVDGSHDGSFEFFADWSLREPRIRPIYQENSGEAIARRRGVQEATFDLVLLLDDDVEGNPGLVSAHARMHADSDNLVVLGYMPTIVPTTRKAGQAPTILYAEDYENTCIMIEGNSGLIFRHLWAGNMSLRRAHALEAGGGDEVRLDYHADLRFGLKCEKAGLTAVFERSLASRHWYERSLTQFARDARRSGRSRAELIREFPEMASTLNPLDTSTVQEQLIVRFFGGPYIGAVVAPVAMALGYALGRAGAWNLELKLTRAVRLIEISREFQRFSKVAR